MKKSTPVFVALLCMVFHVSAQRVTQRFHGQATSFEYGILSRIPKADSSNLGLKRVPLHKMAFFGNRAVIQNKTLARSAADADYGFNAADYQGQNVPMQSATDAFGNIYTTGLSSDAVNPKGNFVVVKTDASGNTAWTYRKPVADFAVEYGMAIAIDASGNPIASGMHWNGQDMDITTLKLDSATGSVIWQGTFPGAANGLDVPSAIAVDDAGNTLVAGITYSGTSIRYLVLKYDSLGVLQWSFTDTNLVEEVWNEPTAIATDATGAIAVTGSGSTSEYYQTYYTIKLSADGAKLWGRDHAHEAPLDTENPESPIVSVNAVANDVALDADGNCYVTGILDTRSGTMGTIKYDGDGNQQWLATHKSGTDHSTAHEIIATQNAVYVSGRHMGDWVEDGLVLASYGLDGQQNWISETTNLADAKIPRMTLDDTGKPVQSGYGYDENGNTLFSTLRYGIDGTVETETSHLIESIATESLNGLVGVSVDGQGNVTLSMSYTYTALGNVFRTMKMPLTDGNPQVTWNSNYATGSRNNKRLLASLAAPDGSVYISGSFGQIQDNAYILNYFVEKYADDGSVEWQKVFNPANGNDVNGIQLQLSPQGHAVVYLMPFGFGDPVRLKKYDASGTLAWEFEKLVYTPALATFFIDADGNSHLSGSSRVSESDENPVFTTLQVSASGTENWITHTPSANADDTIFEISCATTDADGNIIVAGAVGFGSFFEQHVRAALLKYDSEGQLQWFVSPEVAGYNSAISGVLLQSDGSIIANGALSDENSGQEKAFVRKYGASGTQQWESLIAEDGRNMRSYKVLELANGELVAASFSVIYGVDNKIVVTRLDADGNPVATHESPLSHFYRDITTDGQNVYLLSQFYGTTMPYRLFYSAGPFFAGKITKISAGETSDESFVGPSLSPFDPGNLLVKQGSLLIPGTLESESSVFQGIVFFTSEFEMLGTDDPVPSAPDVDWLGQNYPNPTNGMVTIAVTLEHSDKIDITLYDAAGRVVAQLYDGALGSGTSEITYSVSGLSSGIYFYQAKTSSGRTASRKLAVN